MSYPGPLHALQVHHVCLTCGRYWGAHRFVKCPVGGGTFVLDPRHGVPKAWRLAYPQSRSAQPS